MDPDSVNRWLLKEARSIPEMIDFTEQFRRRLLEAGLDFSRFSIGYQTLHPEVAALAFGWEAPKREVELMPIGLEVHSSSRYLVSPVRVVHEGGDMVRCRLEGDDPELEYAFLEDLMDRGYTDYLVLGVPMARGRNAPLMLATKRPGGFTDDDIAGLKSIRSILGLYIEIHASHHVAHGLLDVYLGHGTGERVIQGAIRRGSVLRYPAALMFSDLRQFTAMSERLPRNFIVHVLNDYFDAAGQAIDAHDGEILKFIGDAVLAVFPVGEGTERQACDRALAAARDMIANLEELNARRDGENKPPLRTGIGLHAGEVWYGNIGASNRLDFTVIGPAVNRAARLEKLAADLGETVLVSEDFARAATGGFDRVGDYELKGIEGLTPAFRPVAG